MGLLKKLKSKISRKERQEKKIAKLELEKGKLLLDINILAKKKKDKKTREKTKNKLTKEIKALKIKTSKKSAAIDSAKKGLGRVTDELVKAAKSQLFVVPKKTRKTRSDKGKKRKNKKKRK